MDTLLYSRKEHWRENALALIIGRILFQGSKLSLANIHSDSALWQLLGHERDKAVDVNEHCYKAMDQLLARQDSIQKKLAQKHLSDGCLILYDITNTWLEGEYKESTLAQHGKGKGGKHGYKQIAIGLITNKEGCPVATEVFSGNTSDQMTVLKQAQELALKYGIEDVIFTGDRGMLTPKRISEVNELGYKTLTALTHPQINQLIEKKVIQLELFDETNIEEVLDPDNPGVRYMLCKNPETLKRERHTRDSLIKRVSCELDKIATVQKKRDPQTVSAKVGGIFKQFNIQKFFEWHVSPEGKLEWTLRQEVIDYEKLLDGCYVIRTDTDNDQLNAKETVKSYKSLAHVEKAFRNLKTVALEIRPIYHRTDERIKAHVFISMLAYYLQWHATKKLSALLQANEPSNQRRWTWPLVIERLKSIRIVDCLIEGVTVNTKMTKPDSEQAKLLELLGIQI